MQPAIKQWWPDPFGEDNHPQRRGWKAAPVKGVRCFGLPVVLVGRPGVRGCFAIAAKSPNPIIWANLWFYGDTPEEVADAMRRGKNPWGMGSDMCIRSAGWALENIEYFERR